MGRLQPRQTLAHEQRNEHLAHEQRNEHGRQQNLKHDRGTVWTDLGGRHARTSALRGDSMCASSAQAAREACAVHCAASSETFVRWCSEQPAGGQISASVWGGRGSCGCGGVLCEYALAVRAAHRPTTER